MLRVDPPGCMILAPPCYLLYFASLLCFVRNPHGSAFPPILPCAQVAAQTLVLGGRLCYLLASTWDFDLSRDLPRHPCLQLSHHSVQGLTQLLCRRLITMTKVRARRLQAKQPAWLFCERTVSPAGTRMGFLPYIHAEVRSCFLYHVHWERVGSRGGGVLPTGALL